MVALVPIHLQSTKVTSGPLEATAHVLRLPLKKPLVCEGVAAIACGVGRQPWTSAWSRWRCNAYPPV